MTGTSDDGLLDTSVFIAAEAGRPLREAGLPALAYISPVTLAELQVGVLAATDDETRARRLETLHAVADIELLAIDDRAAAAWALLRQRLAALGRRLNVNDLWIAATALSHDLPVVTQDADFDPIDGVAGVRVIRV